MPDISKAVEWGIETCNDPNVGYDDGTFRNGDTSGGITYYDCSSFVNYALLAAGFETPDYAPTKNAFWTGVECSVLESLGFQKVSLNGVFEAGDVGWKDGHTEMCYQGGTIDEALWMGAHNNARPLADQVSMMSSPYNTPSTKWTYVYRYTQSSVEPNSQFSFYVAAAMCGNFWVESNLNPGIWEGLIPSSFDHVYQHDGIGGYGIGQWTNVEPEGRCWQLYQYLQEHEFDCDSGDGQCGFIIYEDSWSTHYSDEFTSLTEFLQSNSTDIDDLATQWMWCWEGIKNSTLSDRQAHGHTAYDYLLEHWQDNCTWYTCNNWLSESQWLNNCVCLYQYFNLNYAGGYNETTGGNIQGESGTSVQETKESYNTEISTSSNLYRPRRLHIRLRR